MDWGVVSAVEESKLRVHLMEGSTSGLTWLCLWTDGDTVYRRLKKPEGTKSLEMTVSADLVQVSGTLTKTNRLSDVMRRSTHGGLREHLSMRVSERGRSFVLSAGRTSAELSKLVQPPTSGKAASDSLPLWTAGSGLR